MYFYYISIPMKLFKKVAYKKSEIPISPNKNAGI